MHHRHACTLRKCTIATAAQIVTSHLDVALKNTFIFPRHKKFVNDSSIAVGASPQDTKWLAQYLPGGDYDGNAVEGDGRTTLSTSKRQATE